LRIADCGLRIRPPNPQSAIHNPQSERRMVSEIQLPALKDGVESVEVNAIKVAVGDRVAADQPVLEVQADKAALEVTAPMAGRVVEVRVKEGDEVKVGQVYLVLEGGNGAATPKKAEAEKPKEPAPARSAGGSPAPVASAPPAPRAGEPPALRAPADGKAVPAGPATRRLARELGVDLKQVPGSGRGGRVTEDDVKGFVRQLASAPASAPVAGGVAAPALPRFEDFGPVERQPLSGLRKIIARNLSLAWNVIPHVTQHDLADITDLESFRKEHSTKELKLTVTAFALKAAAIALKQFPSFNASLDTANTQLVVKRHYHVGVAVDTPSGLVVPVLRDVDRKSVLQLAEELTAVAGRARDGKLDPAEMKGGTFTITNLGGIGGTAFTPIVNWPEVAILGLSRGRTEPAFRDGQVVPRLMLPLSLSYDHRVIDGAAAARFTRFVAELLEQPLRMVLHA
jgi:pyruvate dehydrogenase E2 component (dihydrolipoamide acetyltransferase)